MALFIGILIILIILFMVFSMALAEWADKDPGELFKGIIKRSSSTPRPMNIEKNQEIKTIASEQTQLNQPSEIKRSKAKQTKSKVVKVTNKKTVKKLKAVTKTKSKKRKTT